jgi:rod shape-determining protein MreD
MQFLFILLFFVLQSTLFSAWLFKPDLFLLILVLAAAGRGLHRGLLWGLGLGFFMDVFSASYYLHVFIYGILGLLLGLIPVGYFRSYRWFAVTSILTATILGQLFYGILSTLIYQLDPGFNFFGTLFLLTLNFILAYLLAEPLARFFGVNVKT